MGEVLSALKAVKGVQAAAHAAGVGSSDTSDPGAQLMSDPLGEAPQMQANPLSTLYPNMPDFSAQGAQQDQPSQPVMDAPQMNAPQMPDQMPEAPVDTQPYDDNTYSSPQQIAASIGKGGDDDNITITGDSWTPKPESGLGRIMDTLLELRGRRPVFKDRTDDANLQSAEDTAQGDEKPGFDQQKLIARVRKFNPDMADKLQEKLTTSTRLQGNLDRQNEVFDMKKREIVLDRAASAMQTPGLDKDPSAYQKMRDRMIAYGQKYNEDVSKDIPEQWDPDVANIVKFGRINVKDQERLDQSGQRITEKGRHDKVTEGISADRLDETGRHDLVTEGIGQQNADTAKGNAAKRPDKSAPHVLNTKNGQMEVRGHRGVITTPDGQQHLFLTSDGTHWVHVNTITPKP